MTRDSTGGVWQCVTPQGEAGEAMTVEISRDEAVVTRSAATFTYTAETAVLGLQPSTGPAAGGHTVTVVGSYFPVYRAQASKASVSVRIGSHELFGTLLSSSLVLCRTDPQAVFAACRFARAINAAATGNSLCRLRAQTHSHSDRTAFAAFAGTGGGEAHHSRIVVAAFGNDPRKAGIDRSGRERGEAARNAGRIAVAKLADGINRAGQSDSQQESTGAERQLACHTCRNPGHRLRFLTSSMAAG